MIIENKISLYHVLKKMEKDHSIVGFDIKDTLNLYEPILGIFDKFDLLHDFKFLNDIEVNSKIDVIIISTKLKNYSCILDTEKIHQSIRRIIGEDRLYLYQINVDSIQLHQFEVGILQLRLKKN
jgi:hypothetical protein